MSGNTPEKRRASLTLGVLGGMGYKNAAATSVVAWDLGSTRGRVGGVMSQNTQEQRRVSLRRGAFMLGLAVFTLVFLVCRGVRG